ncbi:GxxExxY protein, partial [Thiococcus pfennigii]
MHENEISRAVVDGALAVHRALGPGLLESVYELALAYELAQRGLTVERQVPISIEYQGV